MKYIFLVLYILVCLNQKDSIAQTSVFENVSNCCEGKLIGRPLDSINTKEEELSIRFLFKTVDIIDIDLNNDCIIDTIKIEKIIDWGDPGDFHKISIQLSGNKKKEFFNLSGWIKYDRYELQFVNSFSKNNLGASRNIIIHRASNTDILLFCFGYVYASQPGLLSIININDTCNADLIFNAKFYLLNFSDRDNDGIKEIVVTKSDSNEFKIKKDSITYKLNHGCFQQE